MSSNRGFSLSIGRLQNQLTAMGVGVITDRDADFHVSGHPARDELTRLYQWVRPRIAVPVHGALRHMVGHAALAQGCQVPATIVQGLGGDASAVDEAVAAGIEALRASVADLSDSEARDDATVTEAARRAVRRVFKSRFDKKPLTDVQVVRI